MTSGRAIDVSRFAAGAVTSTELRVGMIHPGEVVGCLGTDEAMLDVVSDLVAAGHRTKVFDDRPRQLLPRLTPGVARRAEALSLAAVAAGASRSFVSHVGAGWIAGPLTSLRAELEDRSAAALRRRQVPDRWTRRQLTPLPFDRRPPVRHDRYLAAFASSCCELVSWPVASVCSTGLRTCDGIEHRLDVLVVAG